MLTRTLTRKQICGEDTGCHVTESGHGDPDASAQRTDVEGTGAGPAGRAVADAVMMRHLRLLVDASNGTISGVRNEHACAIAAPLCPLFAPNASRRGEPRVACCLFTTAVSLPPSLDCCTCHAFVSVPRHLCEANPANAELQCSC